MNKLLFLIFLVSTNCLCMPLNWHKITNQTSDNGYDFLCLQRAAIPHGWLLMSCQDKISYTYIPDEKHEWRID